MDEAAGDDALPDLGRYLKAGDTVLWGQANAEPLTLTRTLVAQHHRLGRLRLVLGIDLAESGALTHARKSIDQGVGIAGVLMGSQRLYRHAHRNPALQLRGSDYTHGAEVGGAPDFIRAAQASRGGLSIIALPATAGARSRIVSSLSGPVTTPRCDAGIFVTEYGVADLRGLGLAARQRRMLDIAAPEHRAALDP